MTNSLKRIIFLFVMLVAVTLFSQSVFAHDHATHQGKESYAVHIDPVEFSISDEIVNTEAPSSIESKIVSKSIKTPSLESYGRMVALIMNEPNVQCPTCGCWFGYSHQTLCGSNCPAHGGGCGFL